MGSYTTVLRTTPRKSTKVGDNIRRDIANEHVRKRKEQIGECLCCGLTDIRCLLFHHVDPKTKKFEISIAGRNRLLPSTIDAEIAKCILVCSNCHIRIHNPTDEDNFTEDILKPLGFLEEIKTLLPFIEELHHGP